MTKLNKILTVAAVILLIVIGAVIFWQRSGSDYSAVYLSTGDVYFGKLSRFPRFVLTDVWFLSKAENGLGVNQFSKAVWGPEDKIVLSKENVVWVAKLGETSELLKAFKNPSSVAPSASGLNQLGGQKGNNPLTEPIVPPASSTPE